MDDFTLEDAEKCVAINEHDLDGENIRQPQHVWSITQELAKVHKRKRLAELDRDLMYAKLDEEIRDNIPEGEKKPTETAIKLEITRMPKMRKAEEAFIQASFEVDQWMGAFESIKARGFSLQRHGDWVSTGWLASETGGRERGDAKDRRAAYAREEQAKFREKERRKT